MHRHLAKIRYIQGGTCFVGSVICIVSSVESEVLSSRINSVLVPFGIFLLLVGWCRILEGRMIEDS